VAVACSGVVSVLYALPILWMSRCPVIVRATAAGSLHRRARSNIPAEKYRLRSVLNESGRQD